VREVVGVFEDFDLCVCEGVVGLFGVVGGDELVVSVLDD